MKIARAKRLGGELIDAIKGSHDDCKILDMVCDNCGESVIYREGHTRKDGTINVSPAWVHRAYKITSTECELRVSSLAISEINERRNVTRGQRHELLVRSLFAMNFNFNTFHYNFDKNLGHSWESELKQAKKFWDNPTRYNPRAIFQYDRVKEYLVSLNSEQLSDLISLNVNSIKYTINLDGIEEADFGELARQHKGFAMLGESSAKVLVERYRLFYSMVISDFHLMLCREVIEYCILDKSKLSILKILIGGIIVDPELISGLVTTDIVDMFLYRIILTDWVSAYEWARAEVKNKKGFG